MKTIKIIIEKSADFYDAYAENMEGVYGAGNSVEEVKKSIVEAIEWHKKQTPDLFKGGYNLSYKYDPESFFNYYSKVFSMPALERLTGINQKQLHHYAGGLSKPRAAQKQKLENALHELGNELISVSF